MSITIHWFGAVLPSKPIFKVRRTIELPPSHAIKYFAWTISSFWFLSWILSVTPLASWLNSPSWRENSTWVFSYWFKPCSKTLSTWGWIKALRREKPNSRVNGWMSAKQRPLGVKKRMAWFGVVCGKTWFTKPSDWIVRNASSSIPIARG